MDLTLQSCVVAVSSCYRFRRITTQVIVKSPAIAMAPSKPGSPFFAGASGIVSSPPATGAVVVCVVADLVVAAAGAPVFAAVVVVVALEVTVGDGAGDGSLLHVFYFVPFCSCETDSAVVSKTGKLPHNNSSISTT